MPWFAAIWAFIKVLLGIKGKDPVQKGLEDALEEKSQEAKAMEAPDRPESRVDTDLLLHARDNSGLP